MDATTFVFALLTLLLGLGLGLAAGIKIAERSRQELRHELRALSAQAVTESSEQVFAIADSRVAATEQVVRPVRESLDRLNERLGDLERSGSSWQAQLKQQVESVHLSGEELRRETRALAEALRRPQVRGHWGELQLRRSLEISGLTSRCTFEEQVSKQTDDGVLRPDVVVSLTGGKQVVIDAKVSLDAFLVRHPRDRRRDPGRGAAAARPPGAYARRLARLQELLAAVLVHPGVRGHVHAGRGDLLAGARHRSGSDRVRRRQRRDAGDPDHADRDAQDDRLRLELRGGRRQRSARSIGSVVTSTTG